MNKHSKLQEKIYINLVEETLLEVGFMDSIKNVFGGNKINNQIGNNNNNSNTFNIRLNQFLTSEHYNSIKTLKNKIDTLTSSNYQGLNTVIEYELVKKALQAVKEFTSKVTNSGKIFELASVLIKSLEWLEIENRGSARISLKQNNAFNDIKKNLNDFILKCEEFRKIINKS